MRRLSIPRVLGAALVAPTAASADAALAEQVASLASQVDWYWTCVAAFLVFFMQSGFALVEAGFTRAKNAVNILMKNLMDFSVGALAFWAVGFGIMFGAANGFFGWGEFFPNPDVLSNGEEANWMYAFLLFQTESKVSFYQKELKFVLYTKNRKSIPQERIQGFGHSYSSLISTLLNRCLEH